jgi:hypothetical protein
MKIEKLNPLKLFLKGGMGIRMINKGSEFS